jgi:predicted metal-dependent hydrolase
MTSKTLQNAAHTIALMTGAGEEALPIVIRKNARSRHMVIRYQPLQHHISVTLPRQVSIAQGLRFVQEKRPWLEAQLRGSIRRVALADGQVIPVLGRHYTITHGGGRGLVRIEGDRIVVPGEAAFLARRLREWLKHAARDEITAIATAKAQQLGTRFRKISLRDTASRWGSCNHKGHLSFSWRLGFAPHEVMAYVVCHEVAHLKHLDHSPAFWMTVTLLDPGQQTSRRWLRLHGAQLYAYD